MNTPVDHKAMEKAKERYGRQVALRDWGWEKQTRIMSSTVAVVGIGGLGCSVATYLALAGVGAIVICDGDLVELSNLNRQSRPRDRARCRL